MRLRDRGTSGRREDALRPHGPRASAPSGAVPVATDPAPSPRPPSTLTPTELVRAAWHAFPGFLTVFLVVTAFPDERHRLWRAVPVARALAFPLAACWAVELWRLRRIHRKAPKSGDVPREMMSRETPAEVKTSFVVSLVDKFFASVLRESERTRVHGTAWYLLGACMSLSLYPCDVAALSICLLAFCDPAASLAGRASRLRLFFSESHLGNRRFANGKSFIGTLACFIVGVLTTWVLFQPELGVFYVASERAVTKSSGDDASSSFNVILFSVFVGGVVAGVEFLGSKTFADDNLIIPVLVGAAAWPARGALLGWQ